MIVTEIALSHSKVQWREELLHTVSKHGAVCCGGLRGYAQWWVLAGTYLAKCIDVDKTRVNLKIWDTVRQLFAHAVDASSADLLGCLYGIDPCSAACTWHFF